MSASATQGSHDKPCQCIHHLHFVIVGDILKCSLYNLLEDTALLSSKLWICKSADVWTIEMINVAVTQP